MGIGLWRQKLSICRELEGIIGPDSDIPAPDVGTNAQTMAWIMDTVSMHRGYSVPGVVTGKPISIGGTLGRADATGQGVVYTIADTARRNGFSLDGARVAIQGFGNVGEATARLLREAGARVVAISDVGGGVSRPDGLDIPFIGRYFQEHGTIADAPGTVPITNERLFALDVDVLVLAALEGQITERNAGTVRARILAEGANGPTTPDADPILQRNGVIVSYFEWAQNRAALAWTRDEVPPRLAANAIAVERVAEATRVRGLYP